MTGASQMHPLGGGETWVHVHFEKTLTVWRSSGRVNPKWNAKEMSGAWHEKGRANVANLIANQTRSGSRRTTRDTGILVGISKRQFGIQWSALLVNSRLLELCLYPRSWRETINGYARSFWKPPKLTWLHGSLSNTFSSPFQKCGEQPQQRDA